MQCGEGILGIAPGASAPIDVPRAFLNFLETRSHQIARLDWQSSCLSFPSTGLPKCATTLGSRGKFCVLHFETGSCCIVQADFKLTV